MASDKQKRKQAKAGKPKPAVHPDGDRRRRDLGITAKQAVRDKRVRQSFWGVPTPDEPAAG
jgi:hypothetical protein